MYVDSLQVERKTINKSCLNETSCSCHEAFQALTLLHKIRPEVAVIRGLEVGEVIEED